MYTNTTTKKAVENKLAQDIEGYLHKAKYEGWREVKEGKHPEAVYFSYFSRKLGGKSYLCMRKMKSTGKFKPYAVINHATFLTDIKNVNKTNPPK